MEVDPSIRATVVNKILTMINDGTLKPGQKLPPERVLAEFLSVSRVSVREALKTLAAMKLVTIKPRDGAFINSVSGDEIFKQENIAKLLDDESLVELFEVRFFIEPTIAEYAAIRATDEDIDRLLEMCNDMQQKALTVNEKSRENYLKLDLDFHMELCKSIDNTVLLGMVSSIVNLMVEGMKKTTTIQGYYKKGYEGHFSVVEAIKTRDPQKAREAMIKHLSTAMTDLSQALGANNTKLKNRKRRE